MFKNSLAPQSRVWIYQSVRKFTPEETSSVSGKVKQFVSQWTSHKEGVIGDGALFYDRFVVLMADEQQVGVSGCSVDSSVHFVKELQQQFNTNFFDRWNIAYMLNGEVHSCDRTGFEKLLVTNIIKDETIVFNNLVQTKRDFETKWQIPYKDSWLKNLQVSNTPFSSVL